MPHPSSIQEKPQTYIDSIETFIVKSLETETSMQRFWSEHYYKNDADGLFLVAYSNYGGGANGLPKQINSKKIIFKGIEFNSITETEQVGMLSIYLSVNKLLRTVKLGLCPNSIALSNLSSISFSIFTRSFVVAS